MKIVRDALVMAMDGSKMVLLRNEGDTRRPLLRPLLEHHADNPKSALQGTDRPGRTFSSASPRRSSLDETDWHQQAKTAFARDAMKLLQENQQELGGDVIVLAAPWILGDFRKHCPEQLKPAIIAEIDKDVVNHSPEEIAKIVDAFAQ